MSLLFGISAQIMEVEFVVLAMAIVERDEQLLGRMEIEMMKVRKVRERI